MFRLIALALQGFIFGSLMEKAGLDVNNLSTWLVLLANVILIMLYAEHYASDRLDAFAAQLEDNDLD